MRPCACDHPGTHPAQLARTDNPPAPPQSAYYAPDLGGELYGGVVHPTGVEATSAPPPCPDPAPRPQRPAMHPSSRRVSLLRFVPAYPLQTGLHGEIERVNARPTATQLPVELRGSTYRAAPDNPDPSWVEVAS